MKGICEKHGEYEAFEIEILGRLIQCGCPKCDEEATLREQKIIEESRKRYIESDLLNRGIEPEFFNVQLSDYNPETPSERKALEAIQALKDGKCKKVLLLGPNGTGKTMLANALAKELNGVRITMYELSARIRQGYNTGYGELEVLDKLLTYPFIAIDEIGRTKGSEAELNWLSYLIDKAHTRGKRLLLISNKHQASKLPADRKGEAIEVFLPNDAISRLRQNSVIVEVEGRDRRTAKTTMAAV